MLTTVEVYTTRGDVLSLSLENPSGYTVQDIDGLDPVKAALVSSSFAQIDGEVFEAASRGSRNMIIKLGLEPDYEFQTVRDLRQNLYKYFMPKSEVRLRFYLEGEMPVEITGRVEDFSNQHFTREPEVSITVLCFDPDFYAITPRTINGSTVSDENDMIVNYEGTVEAGFLFRMALTRPMTEITLYNNPGDVQQSMEFVEPLSAGDVLEISTVPGAKRATRIRNGVQQSVLYGVSPSATWVQLKPGMNRIRALTAGAPMPFTMTYKAKYGGL